MPHGELLLELLSEEIPARMQPRALDDLVGLVPGIHVFDRRLKDVDGRVKSGHDESVTSRRER